MSEYNQQFDSHIQWVNKAPSWLTRCKGKAICFDARGRQCRMGVDFMRAEIENAYPIRWIWDWQVPWLLVADPLPDEDDWPVEDFRKTLDRFRTLIAEAAPQHADEVAPVS